MKLKTGRPVATNTQHQKLGSLQLTETCVSPSKQHGSQAVFVYPSHGSHGIVMPTCETHGEYSADAWTRYLQGEAAQLLA